MAKYIKAVLSEVIAELNVCATSLESSRSACGSELVVKNSSTLLKPPVCLNSIIMAFKARRPSESMARPILLTSALVSFIRSFEISMIERIRFGSSGSISLMPESVNNLRFIGSLKLRIRASRAVAVSSGPPVALRAICSMAPISATACLPCRPVEA